MAFFRHILFSREDYSLEVSHLEKVALVLNRSRRRKPGREDTHRSKLAIRLRRFILLVQVCADSRKPHAESRHHLWFSLVLLQDTSWLRKRDLQVI